MYMNYEKTQRELVVNVIFICIQKFSKTKVYASSFMSIKTRTVYKCCELFMQRNDVGKIREIHKVFHHTMIRIGWRISDKNMRCYNYGMSLSSL